MNAVSVVLLALAMSTDAFAAAIGKGAVLQRPRWREALRIGLIFGCIEAVTPVIGWAIGAAAASYITAFDHWIAFGLLGVLGARMIHAGLRDDGLVERPVRHGFWAIAATGFATSIDAMAVGASLAFLEVPILPVALTVGATTLLMVTLGIMLGRLVGAMIGRRAEVIGGIVLIGIGAFILYEHLSGAA
ncbi:manganese efflux pump MntP family protein [Coralloluteibacterium thermophilus]|uniref:Putative manganese efflux pump MntP n=1 Tax=Coralloluteibacterium thermophilum TaxID=2707049 RepID=A0ABV9NNR0_9GAMM